MVAIAVILAVAVFVWVPRPAVTIDTQSYATTGCVNSTAQTVTATFTLLNQGPADGTVDVDFLVDRTTVASQMYVVPAHGATRGSLQATLHDCRVHQYGLQLRYESSDGG